MASTESVGTGECDNFLVIKSTEWKVRRPKAYK